ncbi:ABC transporter substrate-binding protein [Faunimonas sp. B44]
MNNWNPLVKPNRTYTGIVYETLIKTAADGITLEPGLATEWSLSPTEMKLTLRPNVVFHDGSPFDADAVKKNIEWIKSSGTQWANSFDTVAEVVVDDPTHVTLKLSRQTPSMAQRLATRGAFMVAPATIDAESWDKANGTGPWVYDMNASQPSAKEVFTYFKDYWAPEDVGVESIVVHVIQDRNVALNTLRSGLVDAAEIGTSIVEAAKGAGLEVVSTPTLVQHFLLLDRNDVFKDENVRKAVCHAADMNAIAEGAFDGFAQPVSQRLLEGQPGHNPDLKGYHYDPELAKEYLAKAGNPKIAITLPMFTGNQTAVTLIAQYLRQIGVSVEPQMMNAGQYFTYYQSNRYPMQLNTSATESVGPLDYYQFRFGPEGVGNPFKAAVPELDAIVERALAENDLEAQDKIWQEMMKYIEDHALDCNFYLTTHNWAYNPERVKDLPTTVMEPSTLRYNEVELVDAR